MPISPEASWDGFQHSCDTSAGNRKWMDEYANKETLSYMELTTRPNI